MRVWRVSTVFAGPLHTDSCSLQVQVDHAPADGSYRTVWRMHLSWTVIAGPNSLLTRIPPDRWFTFPACSLQIFTLVIASFMALIFLGSDSNCRKVLACHPSSHSNLLCTTRSGSQPVPQLPQIAMHWNALACGRHLRASVCPSIATIT